MGGLSILFVLPFVSWPLCFNPLNRGMGGLSGAWVICVRPRICKFQSPQSGHGWFKLKSPRDFPEDDYNSFNPLNRGMGGLSITVAGSHARMRTTSFNPLNRGMGGLSRRDVRAEETTLPVSIPSIGAWVV